MLPRRILPLCVLALTSRAEPVAAQTAVPIVTIPEAPTASRPTFAAILGVTHLPSGDVLVNDAGRRQVVKLNAAMTTSTVIIDSTPGTSNSYGPRPTPMLRYLGDSSLFVDATSSSLLVIDPTGRVVRAMSAPNPRDLQFLGNALAYVDPRGRLVYRAPTVNLRMSPSPAGRPPQLPSLPDSMAVIRADFDSRVVDTIGRVRAANGTRSTVVAGADGQLQPKLTINPINPIDDFAVLADGSVAFIRGQDYHVDVLTPDGQLRRGAKLPYDWKRLSDEDKQRMLDSAKAAASRAQIVGPSSSGPAITTSGGGVVAGASGAAVSFGVTGGPVGGADAARAAEALASAPRTRMGPPIIETVPVKELADFLPPIRTGAARADLDGNLWLLPNTSAQSRAGELVYDVVDNTGQLTHRVRLPKGRSIVGFGAGGVVYMMNGDRTNGFTLERSTVPRP